MVKHTSDCGQLLFTEDDAFGPPKSYGINTKYLETFELMLKNAGLPPPAAPRDEAKNWNYTRIEYQLEQEVYFYYGCDESTYLIKRNKEFAKS
jgi:hypothetical protein